LNYYKNLQNGGLFDNDSYKYEIFNYKNIEKYMDFYSDLKYQQKTFLHYKRLFVQNIDALVNLLYTKYNHFYTDNFYNIKFLLKTNEVESEKIIKISIKNVISDFFLNYDYRENILCKNITENLGECVNKLNDNLKLKNNCEKPCHKYDIYTGNGETMYKDIFDYTVAPKLSRIHRNIFYLNQKINNNINQKNLENLENLFIVCVSRKEYMTESIEFLLSMTVIINCAKDKPDYQEHMFISKNIDYLLYELIIKNIVKVNNIKNDDVLNENLSLKLHSFATQVLKADKILFQPLDIMTYLLSRKNIKIERIMENIEKSDNYDSENTHMIYVDDNFKNIFNGILHQTLIEYDMNTNTKKVKIL
jgi:hypothetical protein